MNSYEHSAITLTNTQIQPELRPDLDFVERGDENRTRTISLGNGAVTAVQGADLPTMLAAGDRD